MSEEYIDFIIEKYAVDYIVHGDDLCLVDGQDVYASAKRRGTIHYRYSQPGKELMHQGKFRSIPRTDGVSTTDIIGRVLDPSYARRGSGDRHDFRVTAERILQFFSPTSGNHSRVVYLPGHWDIYRPEYIQAFELAKSHGDFLLVGVYSDTSDTLYTLTCLERCLSVLGCKVDW